MWFGTALSKMVRLKFEITLHGTVNKLSHTQAAYQPHLIAYISDSILQVRINFSVNRSQNENTYSILREKLSCIISMNIFIYSNVNILE